MTPEPIEGPLDAYKADLVARATKELLKNLGWKAELQIDLPHAIALIGQLQLALRHPDNVGIGAKTARTLIDGLIGKMTEEGLDVNAELARLGDNLDYDTQPKRTCRVCGCTDDNACPGGCHWTDMDLCSRCESEDLKMKMSSDKPPSTSGEQPDLTGRGDTPVGIGPPFATVTDNAGTRIVGGRIGGATVLTVPEWQAQAACMFGNDPSKWRFKCPICGHVQTPEDFRQFKDRGATPQTAAQECIGRYMPKPYRAFGDKPGPKRSPCDYAAFGLFRLGVELTHEDGTKVNVFPFADPEPPPPSKSTPDASDSGHSTTKERI